MVPGSEGCRKCILKATDCHHGSAVSPCVLPQERTGKPDKFPVEDVECIARQREEAKGDLLRLPNRLFRARAMRQENNKGLQDDNSH